MGDTEVLVVGAGPVGLTVAAELQRRAVACRIVEALPVPPRYAKAVGIQPRTLELWDEMGIVHTMLDASTQLRGQILFVNGREVSRLELALPADVPYGFVGLPQYETERLLAAHLTGLGATVERGTNLRSFTQDASGVTATLEGPGGTETVHAQYLVGCDGAHSTVRKGLGLSFEGDAFPEEYMLGDVEVDWSMPAGYAVRAMHRTDDTVDDLLVCIPLPGPGRYRMSMFVPDELSARAAGAVSVEHGLDTARRPELPHLQAVLDRLAPEAVTARNLRWSSAFRISHRIVDRYAVGRVFVAGDAAHIHPPTGAQGMNTGIQDAYNLAWKLAAAVRGRAADGLTDSYDSERRPVGEEVVGRTVRHARSGIEADREDPAMIMRREAQLLITYRDSPIVSPDPDASRFDGGPAPGDRAPDARGLTRDAVAFPLRLFELTRGGRHTLLCYVGGTVDSTAGGTVDAEAPADAARELVPLAERIRRVVPDIDVYLVVLGAVPLPPHALPTLRDEQSGFRDAYAARGAGWYLLRPDGHVAGRAASAEPATLVAAIERTLRVPAELRTAVVPG